MVDPISLLIAGGIVGYALKPDGKIAPVTYNNLRESKPVFYKKVNIDISTAREDEEFPLEGTLIYVENPTTPTESVYIKLDEPDRDSWELTTLRKLRIPFYRFFLTNEAGIGTLTIYIGRGLQVEPFEGVVDTVGAVLNSMGDVSVPSPSDEEILGWDSTAEVWVAYALTDLALFSSHKARHQDGGLDEISLTGLSGEPADTVNKTGVQTIAGVKTFSSIPVLPASNPTTANQATRKAYVDLHVLKSLFDANTILYATSDNTPEAKTRAELLALLSGQATGAFDWNSQNLTGIGAITGGLNVSGGLDVNGATLLHSGLGVAGLTNLQQTLVHSTLGVAGLASFVEVFITNNITIGGTVDGVNVSAHKTRHQDGGADEMTIAGLAGTPAELIIHAALTTAHGAVSAAIASKMVVRDASARAKFAAPGAAGDALIKGTRATTAELPALTDEKIWKGTGGNVEELTIAASRIVGRKAAGDVVALTGAEVRTVIGWTDEKLLKGAGAGVAPDEIDVPISATKELWVPVTYSSKAAGLLAKDDFPAANCTDVNDFALMSFKCPHDFTAISSALVVVIPRLDNAAANWDIFSDYGAVGEAYNIHSEQDVGSTYNITALQLFGVSVAGILSNLVADDYVGIKILLADAIPDFWCIGLRFRYT